MRLSVTIGIGIGMLAAAFTLGNAHAQEQEQDDPLYITLGARIMATGWEGENKGSSDTSFESENGGALGLRFLMQKGRLYGGISLQGGEYDFEDGSPDRIFDAPLPIGGVSDEEATIERGEIDLLLGYYFWDKVSLFLDLKSVTNEWQDEDYALRYSGLGLGVAGVFPLSGRWTLYGTFGLVPLQIRADGDSIGDGLGSALELGAVWGFARNTNLVLALRNQHQQYDFDNGAEQTHDIGGLVIGINHRFDVN